MFQGILQQIRRIMRVRLIVFDMAGTTVEDNDYVAKAVMKAMHIHGFPDVTVADVNVVMGYAKPVAIRHLLEQFAGADHASDAVLVNRIHGEFKNEMIRFYDQGADIREKEGASDAFLALRARGVKVGLDTGFSRDIADVIIRRLGWQQDVHFDVSVTSDEVERGRPFPDMIYKAMQITGVRNVEEVAKVGDTVSDLQEGNAAGCHFVIGISTGAYTKEELMLEAHTHIISKLGEIPSILSEDVDF